MAPRVDPVATDETLPARADVVIIGGGIIGTSTALFLAQRGVSTVLCEKGHIAGEQSSRNWGWCRKMARDPREIPLVIESLRLWQGMNETVEAETGFRTCGIMYLAETAADLSRLEAWLDHAREYQLDTRVIDGAEVARLLPGSAKPWAGALYTASDGKAEPQHGGAGDCRRGASQGAAVVTNCAVRGIETAAGRIAGVVTEKGRIACGSVVLAGGAWSRLFCGNLGVDLPQLKVLGSVMRTERLDGGPEISAWAASSVIASGWMAAIPLPPSGCGPSILSPTAFGCCRNIFRACSCIGGSCGFGSACALPRNGAPRGVGNSTGRRRSRQCGCSIPRPTRSCWSGPAPVSPRRSRLFAMSRWRKAGAA